MGNVDTHGPVRINSGNGGLVVSFGFMSGRELYEHGIIYKIEKDSSSSSIKVLDIDPSPLEIEDET